MNSRTRTRITAARCDRSSCTSCAAPTTPCTPDTPTISAYESHSTNSASSASTPVAADPSPWPSRARCPRASTPSSESADQRLVTREERGADPRGLRRAPGTIPPFDSRSLRDRGSGRTVGVSCQTLSSSDASAGSAAIAPLDAARGERLRVSSQGLPPRQLTTWRGDACPRSLSETPSRAVRPRWRRRRDMLPACGRRSRRRRG